MILEQNPALMVKLQPMERTSDTLGVTEVKLRESPICFVSTKPNIPEPRPRSRSRSYCHFPATVGHIQRDSVTHCIT
jgi:hypothetical protein